MYLPKNLYKYFAMQYLAYILNLDSGFQDSLALIGRLKTLSCLWIKNALKSKKTSLFGNNMDQCSNFLIWNKIYQ